MKKIKKHFSVKHPHYPLPVLFVKNIILIVVHYELHQAAEKHHICNSKRCARNCFMIISC